MRYNLAELARRQRNPRRSSITLRDIVPPAMLATDLYRSSYMPIVEGWSSITGRLEAEYARTLAQMTTDAPNDLKNTTDTAERDIDALIFVLTARLTDWTLKVEKWQRGKWRGAVLSATGVDLGTLIGPADVRDTLETVLARNVDLVKDVSAVTKRRISEAVFGGLTRRDSAAKVGRAIRESVEMSRRRAKNIAADQLSTLTSELAQERRREAGLTIYRYRHSGKLHPRENHKERDGNLYAENHSDAGKEISGVKINAPIPSDQRAGIPINCGCRELAVLVLDGEIV